MSLNQHSRFVVPLVITLVVLNIISLGFLWYKHLDQGHSPGLRDGRPDPQEFVIRELGLDEEQTLRFKTLMRTHTRETDSIRHNISVLKEQLFEELFVESPDSTRVSRLSDDVGKEQAAFEVTVFRHFNDLKQICKPEQYDKLKKLVLDVTTRLESGQPPQPRPSQGGHPPPRPGEHPPPSGE